MLTGGGRSLTEWLAVPVLLGSVVAFSCAGSEAIGGEVRGESCQSCFVRTSQDELGRGDRDPDPEMLRIADWMSFASGRLRMPQLLISPLRLRIV